MSFIWWKIAWLINASSSNRFCNRELLSISCHWIFSSKFCPNLDRYVLGALSGPPEQLRMKISSRHESQFFLNETQPQCPNASFSGLSFESYFDNVYNKIIISNTSICNSFHQVASNTFRIFRIPGVTFHSENLSFSLFSFLIISNYNGSSSCEINKVTWLIEKVQGGNNPSIVSTVSQKCRAARIHFFIK